MPSAAGAGKKTKSRKPAHENKQNNNNARRPCSVIKPRLRSLIQKRADAYLPVGAYQTAMDGELIWIITVKWEYPSMAKDSGLGHIRIFAFNQKSFEKVGFVTCG
ncbi:MAG: hypothetical protein WCJ07_11170 [Verrucomicrobiota bacterium]